MPPVLTAKEREELFSKPRGFSDPAMAPRGSHPNPRLKLPKTAEEKIRLTAKKPGENHVKRPEWRENMAEVRRAYYESSMRTMAAREKRLAEVREQHEKNAELAAEQRKNQSSEIATIRDSVAEKIVRRTPEEKETLRLKREHNRLVNEKRVLEAKSEAFLRLYQQSASFIVTEKDLEARIASQFVPSAHIPSVSPCENIEPKWGSILRAERAESVVRDYANTQKEIALREAVEGTVAVSVTQGMSQSLRFLPGLPAVRAALKEQR